MKILVTGANGQVGTELCKQSEGYGFSVIATDYQELDITDQQAVALFVADNKPDIIINSAAYTAVDKAEEEPEMAERINALGPKNLAGVAAEHKIPLLHISTDYVYSGNKTSPYIESDKVDPIGVYGETKINGENYVREALDQYVTLRTAWVFGVAGNNFVKTMVRVGAERDELGVVADQKGCPTFAGDIAGALLAIANDYDKGKTIAWGTYHFCGAEETTWHGFAEAIFDEAVAEGVLSSRPKVNALTTDEYPTPAKRPANSVMCCDQFIQAFPAIGQPSWKPGLKRVVESLK